MRIDSTRRRFHSLPWLPTLFIVSLWLLAAGFARGEGQVQVQPGYTFGFAQVSKLANELHAALEPKKKQAIQPGILLAENVPSPSAGPVEIQKNGQLQHTVQISAGCIRFLNSVSHAKALSAGDNDVVKAYAVRVAAADIPPAVTDGMAPEKAWPADVMNIQATQFNQMAGAIVAIDYAHHYLGHYKKYTAQLTADANGAVPPMSKVISEKEWREAVLKGAKNALDCGLGVEGLKTLFECVQAMPTRPAWCAYFVPDKADLSKLSKDLQRLENDFFLVGK